MEQPVATKSLGKAVEIQADFGRSGIQGYMGQVIQVGEIVTDMARDAQKPYEGLSGEFGRHDWPSPAAGEECAAKRRAFCVAVQPMHPLAIAARAS